MTLRDDLMVVVPDYVVAEGWYLNGIREVRALRESEARNCSDTSIQKEFPETCRWLATFETDPETVIMVPLYSDGMSSVVGGPRGEYLSIGRLRELRSSRDGWAPEPLAFLDTFETIESSAFDPEGVDARLSVPQEVIKMFAKRAEEVGMSEFDSFKTLLASSTVGKAFVGVGLGRSWTVEQLLNELICKIEERDAALAQARRDRDRTLERLAKATHKLREEEKAGTK